MSTSTVKIVKSVLEEQVKEGKSIEFLMEYYGLKESPMRAAVKAAGLKLKRQIAPAFVFVDDASEVEVAETAAAPVADAEEEAAPAKKDESIF